MQVNECMWIDKGQRHVAYNIVGPLHQEDMMQDFDIGTYK